MLPELVAAYENDLTFMAKVAIAMTVRTEDIPKQYLEAFFASKRDANDWVGKYGQ